MVHSLYDTRYPAGMVEYTLRERIWSAPMSSRTDPGSTPETQSPQDVYPSRRTLRHARVAAERVGDPTAVSLADPFAMVVAPPAPHDTPGRRGHTRSGGPQGPRRRELRGAGSTGATPALPTPPRETSPALAVSFSPPAFSPPAPDRRSEDAHGSIVTGEVTPVGEWLVASDDGGPDTHGTQAGDSDSAPSSPRVHRRDRERAGDKVAQTVADMRAVPVSRWLPQAGVVAVMAAATVGNSLAGPFQPSASSESATTAFAPTRDGVAVDVDAPGQPVTSDLEAASDVVPGEDGILRARGAEEASRSGERTPLPGCNGVPPEYALSNGEVPDQYLCTLANGRDKLRADAAVAFALLSQAYAAQFGRDICVTSSYRTYAQQVAVKREKGWLAAQPGTSEHGYGLAVDLCGGVETGGEAYWWLRDNAPAYGWDNPSWARPEGSKTELWHWEYVAGQW